MATTTNDENEVRKESEAQTIEMVSKVLWVLIPLCIGGFTTFFTGLAGDLQLVVWGIMALIVIFGLWANKSKSLRRRREVLEQERWDNLLSKQDERWNDLHEDLDQHFDKIDQRFDEMDQRFDLSEESDRSLLRNELVKMHREWVEQKGYITLEALEYADRIHDAYNAVDGNETGDQLWKDLHSLPLEERRVRD